MPPIRRAAMVVLVVGVAIGCSATSTPSASPTSSSLPTRTARPTPGTLPTDPPLPAHQTLDGPDVAGAFDLATDGRLIAWSSGAVDVDAPALWTFDPASGAKRLVYRSPTRGAILANLALRDGTFAFAEVTARPDGSRTWRLVLVDSTGGVHVLDTNDVPPTQSGVLPMAAVTDHGVTWATTHAGTTASLRCDLRCAPFATLRVETVRSAPCDRIELWYPRTDGRRLVYGTVEYPTSGAGDERHVYVVAEDRLGEPRRLDTDGAASLPAILGDSVVWKSAPRELNMFSASSIVELALAPASAPRVLPFRSGGAPQLTTPSIGPGFIVGDDVGGSSVTAWDRTRSEVVRVDELEPADPGFVSGTRLAGNLLAWFYTSSTSGRGVREIRWLELPSS